MTPTRDDDGTLGAVQLADDAGISYRQLDYWCRIGILEPQPAAEVGSGFQRRFAPVECDIARVLGRLCRAWGNHIGGVAGLRPLAQQIRDKGATGTWQVIPGLTADLAALADADHDPLAP